MKFTHFFIDHPIFASVISFFITIVGAVAYFALPVAQYPEIAPPTIQIAASYPGASAEVVSQTVSTPLEQQINGVENMLYMSSQATGDGKLTITVTFRLGTNLDTAQVLTQNRIATALPRLPDQVQRLGVTVKKASPDLMMVVHLFSPADTRDQLYLSNYASLQVKDVLARVPGVGDVNIVGARDYAMRIWLDPEKVAARNLTAGEVVSALQAENVQVSAGVLNQPPVSQPGAFQLSVETLGRLSTPEQFGDIVIAKRSAHFTLAYSAIGLSPDGGSTWLLPRLVGLRRAQELAIANRRFSADEAAAIGLITRAVDDEELEAETERVSRSLASAATSALGRTRALLQASFSATFESQMETEARAIAEASRGAEHREGVRAFLDKRKPDFSTATGRAS